MKRHFASLAVIAFAASLSAGCGSAGVAVGSDDAGPDAHHMVSTPCDDAQLSKGCVADRCRVTATVGALPEHATVTVTQKPAPSALAGDAIDGILCDIAVSKGLTSVPNLTLSISQKAVPASDGVLFRYASPSLSELVVASQPSAETIEGLVVAPGEFGATHAPAGWSPAGVGAVSVSSSGDEPSLLLNLSSQTMSGAYFDGTRLYACNGPRLLIYDTLPANPGVKPDVVLGQPDVDTREPQTTSSLFGSTACSGIWSDGSKLAVLQGSRVLIWNAIPTVSQTPADLVLGQPDFSSNIQNAGGVSGSSLSSPWSLDSDGKHLVVADTFNNRVLVWSAFPTLIDQPADLVVGQANLSTNGSEIGAVPINAAQGATLTATGIFLSGFGSPGLVHVPTVTSNNPTSDFVVLPNGVSFQPTASILRGAGSSVLTPGGGLAATDMFVARIGMMKSVPTTGPASLDFVLGQPALNYIVQGPSTASTAGRNSIYQGGPLLGGGKMFLVADAQRLLLFDTSPSYNFEPASRVLGQAGFSTNGAVDYRGMSASTLAGPADVAFANGVLAVADRGNNRVLLYKATDIAAGNIAASVVLGQPDSTSYVPNLDQRTPSAARLSGPAAVALDGTHLIVSDTENHRVLIWNAVPSATGTPADMVLGQSDFTKRRPNNGRGDANGDGFSDADADGFFYPMGVASDGTHLFVADRVNHRVLIWLTFPKSNGQRADAVIGQSGFTSLQPNAGNGGFTVVPNGLNLPSGVTLVGTSLWIADTENNRLVRWDNVTTSPAPAAFLGQSGGSTVTNPNYEVPGQPYVGFPVIPGTGTATGSVLRPRSMVVSGDRLYVSETDSHRIHMFNATSFAPVGELGQATDSASSPNANGVSAASLSAPGGMASDGHHLWVADAGNHRVLGFAVTTDPATGASADEALGQLAFETNGFNQTSTAANGATLLPRGLSIASGKLYVADTGNHRVLAFKTPLVAGEPPLQVYGQPNGTLALPNSGGAASAATLSSPRGVFSDGTRLFIADTGNNRVLIYDATSKSTAAALVLGQPSFAVSTPNPAGAGASTMQGPTGVYFDGKHLWVADSGNHRVLVWNKLPASNGEPANVVLGQTSFADVLPNHGGAEASASTLSFPAAIESTGGVVYIADSGNNRVISYTNVPSSNGASADGVLGQPNLTSRLAATSPVDLTRLAGPVGLAADAENLYVVDRDLARAVAYRVGTLESTAPAFLAIGGAGGLPLQGPGGIAVERTPYFTSRVYIGDTGDNQVTIVAGVSRLTAP